MTDEHKTEYQKDYETIQALEKKMQKENLSPEDYKGCCQNICDLMKKNYALNRDGMSSLDFLLRKRATPEQQATILETFEQSFPENENGLALLKSRMTKPITWSTEIIEEPEDMSVQGICNRLEKNEYTSDTMLLMDCSKLSEHTINNINHFDDAKSAFDKLLTHETTHRDLKDNASYYLGEIASARPEVKTEIAELFSHHPGVLDSYLERKNDLYNDELTEINNASKEIIQKRESNQEYIAFLREKAGISSPSSQQEQETKTPNEASKSTPSSNGVDTSRNQGVDF
jgi:hypothetical protein